jgi:hypothetical protein
MEPNKRFRSPSPPIRYDIFTPPPGSPEVISMPYTPEIYDLERNDPPQITYPPDRITEPTKRIRKVIKSIQKKATRKPLTRRFYPKHNHYTTIQPVIFINKLPNKSTAFPSTKYMFWLSYALTIPKPPIKTNTYINSIDLALFSFANTNPLMQPKSDPRGHLKSVESQIQSRQRY